MPRPPLNSKTLEKANDVTPEQAEENHLLLRRNSIQSLFNGYDYDIEQLRHQLVQDKRKLENEEENNRIKR